MRPIDKLLGVREYRSVAGGRLTLTAGGAGDNTATALLWVPRLAGDGTPFMTAKLILSMRATLAQAATLSLPAVLIRDATSAGGAGAANFAAAVAFGVVATGGTGGSTELVTRELDIDLSNVRSHIGVTVTADLSAAGTDTAEVQAVWLFGGGDRSIISNTPIVIGSPS